jgi:hypothetical protein
LFGNRYARVPVFNITVPYKMENRLVVILSCQMNENLLKNSGKRKANWMNGGYMKKIAVMICSAAILASPVWAHALEVTFFVGQVSIERSGTKIGKVAIGTNVQQNDIITTGKKSVLTLAYKDGSEVKISENSSIKIGKMLKDTDVAPVVVVSGIVTTKFLKLAKGSDIRRNVYTPTTVCAVRGTEFTVAVADGGDSRVELTEGSLDVHNPYGGQQINEGQKVKTSVAGDPTEDSGFSGTVAEWKKINDESLNSEPEGKENAYKTYLNDLSVRSDANAQKIDDLGKEIKNTKGKDELAKKDDEIKAADTSVEEDYYLGDASRMAIDNITKRFQSDKKEMYSKFLALKKESNKVCEQQKRNYEAIKAVRESYKKAYDSIMSSHKENTKKIKEGVDLQKVKPKID